ncbi:MAG: zinc ribbon domain-containing protein, partial [Rhodospirillales bacterium]
CRVVEVDSRFTSQICSECDHVDASSRLSQSEFRCVECGYEAHADVNAARNILKRGLAVVANETKTKPTGGGLPLAVCGDLANRRSAKQKQTGASLKKVAA